MHLYPLALPCALAVLAPVALTAQTSASATAEVTVRIVGPCPTRGRDCHKPPHPPHPALVSGTIMNDSATGESTNAKDLAHFDIEPDETAPIRAFLQGPTARSTGVASVVDHWLTSTEPTWEDAGLVAPLTIVLTLRPSLAPVPCLTPTAPLLMLGAMSFTPVVPGRSTTVVTITAEY